MTKYGKLLARVLSGRSDSNIDFDDLRRLLEHLGFAERTRAVIIAEVPELPGCMAHGKTPDEALVNCKEAIDLWLDIAKEFGRPIPEPKGRRLQYA